ncbi:MAG: hypothetical protein AB1716_14870 [Planctomycetota bacterium]
MLELNGSFSGFLDALFAFISEFLTGLLGWLTTFLGGLNFTFS